MGLPWHNSDSEMFVNLNIKSFGELPRVFVHGFRSRITISRKFMLSSINNDLFNVFCYADDLILTSLSVTGLQELIDTASSYIIAHGL